MPKPLEGIRVIDWTIWQQGPVASAMLADLGAEVIKIERPGAGDPRRSMPPFVERGAARKAEADHRRWQRLFASLGFQALP